MTPRPRTPAYIFEISLLFTILVWGVNFPIVKAALQVMHPFVFNALRFTVSLTVLGALYFRQAREASRRADMGVPMLLRILGLGILGHFLYQYFFILGIERTTSGNAALIMTSSPLWVALVALVLRVESLRLLAWIGLGFTLCGTAVIVLGGPADVDVGRVTLLGNALMVGAALSWGTYTALSRPVMQRVDPGALTLLSMAAALPFLWLIALPYWSGVAWEGITFWVWAAIFFSGGLSTGVAYVIWNFAVKHVGASHTAAYGNVIPIVALISGYLFLGEAVTLLQVTGGALMITGLVLMRRERRNARLREARALREEAQKP